MNEKKQKWNLDAPWCLGSEDYTTLVKHTGHRNVRQILELGSGQSTFQLAQDFTDAELCSLENDPTFWQKTNNALSQNGFSNACVMLASIRAQLWKGGLFMTYDMSVVRNILPIDLLVVDGPVERLFPIGREAALYLLFDKCVPGAVIGLDDYHRESAKTAVKNWLVTFGDSLTLVEETASFAVLRKVSECTHPKMTLYKRIQSVASTCSSLTTKSKYAVKNMFRRPD